MLSCGPEPATSGDTVNAWHMIPFECRYLGFKLPQLDGCHIACPRSVLEKHDIRELTAELHCSHPDYDILRCSLD